MRHLKIVKWVFVPVFFLGIIAAAVVNFYNADYAKNALDFFRARFLGGQSVEEAVAKYSARHFDDITRYNAPEKRFAKNAQPAPVRCSSRVWDFPTSILQRKMVFVYTKTLLATAMNAF